MTRTREREIGAVSGRVRILCSYVIPPAGFFRASFLLRRIFFGLGEFRKNSYQVLHFTFSELDALLQTVSLPFVVVVQTAASISFICCSVLLENKFRRLTFTDINDCVNHTCQNGGSCVDGINNFTCNCLKGYTGSHCQTGIPL